MATRMAYHLSSIIKSVDESVNVGESTAKAKNTNLRGVGGSSPLTGYSKRVNALLCDAIPLIWNDYVNSPSVNDMLFLTTWFTDSRDYEIIFRKGVTNKPMQRMSTDRRMQGYDSYVDIHIFVRTQGGDTEPDILATIEQGIEDIIELNHTTLIPNARVFVDFLGPASSEDEDDVQALWHSVMNVRVAYEKFTVD